MRKKFSNKLKNYKHPQQKLAVVLEMVLYDIRIRIYKQTLRQLIDTVKIQTIFINYIEVCIFTVIISCKFFF